MNSLILKTSIITMFLFVISGCGSQILFYKINNEVNSALSDTKNPPKKATPTNLNIQLGNWRLDAISASPNGGQYLALGFLSLPSHSLEGKLEIYKNFGKLISKTFDNNQLRKLIENSSEHKYGNTPFTFHPYALGYESDNILIIHLEVTDLVSAQVEEVDLFIDLLTNKVDRTSVFFDSTAPRPFPVHASKTKYNFEVINGEMFVNGNKLAGLPKGIDKKLHDEVTVGKK